MSENYTHNVSDVISRLKSALKVGSDTDLAKVMNIKPNVLWNWKSRKTADYELIISVCVKNNLNLNWVLSGGEEINNPIVEESPPTYRSKDELLIASLLKTVNLLEDRLKKTEVLLEEVQNQLKEARDRISALTQKRAG